MPKPKKALTRKNKSQKKPKVDEDEDAYIAGELLTAAVGGDNLRRQEVMEDLKKSKVVERIAATYKALQIRRSEWLHTEGSWTKERWEAEIDDLTAQLKEELPEALYLGALIAAAQIGSGRLGRVTIRRNIIRRIIEWQFVRKRKRLMEDGRGRKSKVGSGDIYLAIIDRGADASRKGVAFDLNVSEKTLDNWRREKGFSSWKEAVQNYVELHKKDEERRREREKLFDLIIPKPRKQ
jgi:hypothetical protein